MLGLESGKVVLEPYDINWPKEYQKEKQILKDLLKTQKFMIEHVGSTSIIGLSAKPIIDIAIGTYTEKDLFSIAKILGENGYEIKDKYEEKNEISACKKPTPQITTHLIHIQIINSQYWNDFMYFKKYLLDHPSEIVRYEELKQKLCADYADDKKKYTASKSEYVNSIIKKSKKLYNLEIKF